MTCMSASTKASKFGLQVSFQSLWSSLVSHSLLSRDVTSVLSVQMVVN